LNTLTVAAGIALRWYSIWYLGRFFTVDVAIAAGHRLIDTGPYRRIRHPAYTGELLAFLGLGLLFHNALSLVVLAAPITLAFGSGCLLARRRGPTPARPTTLVRPLQRLRQAVQLVELASRRPSPRQFFPRDAA
jgi:hypothetical protein